MLVILPSAYEHRVHCMATCNDNGFLKHYTGVNNEVALNSPILNNPVCCTSEPKKTITSGPIMPPRATMEPVFVTNNFAPDSDLNRERTTNPNHRLKSFNQMDGECSTCAKSTEHIGPQRMAMNLFESDVTFNGRRIRPDLDTRRSCYRRRLEAYAERLKSVRMKSAAVLTRLIAMKLRTSSVSGTHSSALPKTISRILAEDETESSSDDESSAPSVPRLEEHWVCTRAVVNSHWHWLITEIKRSEQNLRNLRHLKASFRAWKNGLPLNLPMDTSTEATCSRVTPFVKDSSRRHCYHDLTSAKCSRLVSELNPLSTDLHLRCSCIPGHIGPCIICCAQAHTSPPSTIAEAESIDLLTRARPLSGHIHPKLSIPGDIQLSLRLESRLAATSSTTFREHKTATRSVTQADKPVCLRRFVPDVNNKITHRVERRSTVNSEISARTTHSNKLLPHGSIADRQLPLGRFRSKLNVHREFRQLPHRPSSKSSNGPSALRRILDLAPDGDQSDTTQSWHASDGLDEQ